MTIQKESLNGSDRYAVNPEAVVKVVREQMLSECDLDKNGKLDRHEMEASKGYVFGTKLKTDAIEGVARTTKDIRSLNRIFGGEHQISNHYDGFIIRDAKRKIAMAIGIDENISNNALRILFGPIDTQISLFSEEEIAFEQEHKLIDGLSLREYNAFLVNNRDRLVEVFNGVSADNIAEIEETDVITEDWCENYDPVEWCYKNGDKGDEYFSIVYRMAFRRSNFYPDYIIQLNIARYYLIFIIMMCGHFHNQECHFKPFYVSLPILP